LRNGDIVQALENIVALMEIRGEEHYRVLAYQRASESVAASGREISDMDDPKELPHVGGSTAEVLRDLADDETPQLLADLTSEIPPGLVEVTRLQNVGPRTAGKLWRELDVTSVEGLAEVDPGSIAALKGFGKKSEERILEAARTYNSTERRMLLDDATELGERLLSFVRDHDSTEQAELAGSLRRRKETIGDLDIVAASVDQRTLADAFAEAEFVDEVVAHGPTKVSIKTAGTDVDLRIVAPESYGALLHHFTGSQAHNVVLRERAVAQGLSISEYGIAEDKPSGDSKDSGGPERRETEPFATEEALFERLGLPYIPPELREDGGELQAAEESRLPELLRVDDMSGDLHVHTNYSDGKGTIQSMAEAAIGLGYEYLVFCDHSQSLRVANGLSPDRLKKKLAEVREADDEYEEIRLLCGSEVDIMKNGKLDYEDALLAELDFVVASVHTAFNLSEKEQTDRMLRAIDNPHVRTIAHPTGRVLNRREPYEVDVYRLIEEAKKTNTALELNSYPDRLDLSVPYVREAIRQGVRITIDTDAHDERALSFMRYGVDQARRAWVEKSNVINTMTLKEFEEFLAEGK
jgi:DNA polymerase (family 10)